MLLEWGIKPVALRYDWLECDKGFGTAMDFDSGLAVVSCICQAQNKNKHGFVSIFFSAPEPLQPAAHTTKTLTLTVDGKRDRKNTSPFTSLFQPQRH